VGHFRANHVILASPPNFGTTGHNRMKKGTSVEEKFGVLGGLVTAMLDKCREPDATYRFPPPNGPIQRLRQFVPDGDPLTLTLCELAGEIFAGNETPESIRIEVMSAIMRHFSKLHSSTSSKVEQSPLDLHYVIWLNPNDKDGSTEAFRWVCAVFMEMIQGQMPYR